MSADLERIETMIGQALARLDSMSRSINSLEARVGTLESGRAAAGSSADEAVRIARKSAADFDDLVTGLKAHLARTEAVRLADAEEAKRRRDEAEAARERAQAEHAKRFERQALLLAEQGRAVDAIQRSIRQTASQSERAKWFIGAFFALITVVGNQTVEIIKALHPAPPVIQKTEVPR